MIDLQNQPCPICATTRSEHYHDAAYPEQQYPGLFTLRKCAECGLLFNSPRLDGKELGELYGSNYYFFLRDDAKEFDRIVKMYQRTVALIAGEVPEKRSIDIGCGRGYFPAALRALGWNATGVEISDSASATARKTLGMDVFTGTVEQYAASSSAKPFPLVTAIDVIEHVPSPDAFVAAIAKITAPGGQVIIDTPNALAHNIGVKGKSWWGFNPFHIYFFSIENLTRLLARHGLRVERSFSYHNSVTPLTARDRFIAILKKAGLAGLSAKAYFALKKQMIRPADPSPLIERAADRIRREQDFNQTQDATAPLAASKTGDNIIVIARR
jgi:2-polyprenyl-3-methyl-5-hydroxy-6-metoxy-1,4-benzoquinol methylase